MMMDGINSQLSDSGVWNQAETMVTSFNHVPGGANVLYMDGHVEFIKFQTGLPIDTTGGKFPITPLVARCNGRTIGAGRVFEFSID